MYRITTSMKFNFVFIVLVLTGLSGAMAQQIPLINSGEVIDKADVLYDSGLYDESAALLLTIPKRDTNYVSMLSELMYVHIAKKDYKKALEELEKILGLDKKNRANNLRLKAVFTDADGRMEEALQLFDAAAKEFPFDMRILYSKGTLYFEHKQYDKASEIYFQILKFNPYYGGCHLNLGRIAVLQGRKTQGLMALSTYISINNSENRWLQFAEKFATSQVEDENSVKVPGKNEAEKLDQLIKSGIALNSKWKSEIDFKAAIVHQLELVIQKLDLLPAKPTDPWLQFYMPLFKDVRDNNATVPFIMNLLTSVPGDLVKKYQKKNQDQLDALYKIANTRLASNREKIEANFLGYSTPVKASFYDNNRISTIGNFNDSGKRIGPWFFYSENTLYKTSEGQYNTAGKKSGVWKFYTENGELKSVENYDTGEVTVFDTDGNKQQHFYLKGDSIHGEVEIYFPCTGLSEKVQFENDRRHGPALEYYPGGGKKVVSNYKNGKYDGKYELYYENGVLQRKITYVDGKMQGEYTEYHPNGKIKIVGKVVDNDETGEWKYYYYSGKLEKTGNFLKGVGTGNWKFYNPDGLLSMERTLSETGNIIGDENNYYKGKKVSTYTYAKDKLVGISYWDLNGKQLEKSGNAKGTFAAKIYYSNGPLYGSGNYKDGQLDGKWTYYYPDGGVLRETTYLNGKTNGRLVEYFRNGNKVLEYNSKDGEIDGYYKAYYKNGKTRIEGWYQNEARQQQWIAYHKNGVKQSDYYYLNGNVTGEAYEYSPEGKLLNLYNYVNDDITSETNFNGDDKIISEEVVKDGRKTILIKYPDGSKAVSSSLLCNKFDGEIINLNGLGKPTLKYNLINGKRHGRYEVSYLNGVASWSGDYVLGDMQGIWNGNYPNGVPETTGRYLSNETDSIYTYFSILGKVESTVTYLNDEKEGVTTIYSIEGAPILEKNYENSFLISYRIANPDGTFGDWIPLKKDAIIEIKNIAGKTIYFETYKNGLLNGSKRIYYGNGTLYSEHQLVDGDYQGPYIINYPDGKPVVRGTYEYDELMGLQEYFNPDGSLQLSNSFVLDVKHGVCKSYKNGKLEQQVTYYNGIPLMK